MLEAMHLLRTHGLYHRLISSLSVRGTRDKCFLLGGQFFWRCRTLLSDSVAATMRIRTEY